MMSLARARVRRRLELGRRAAPRALEVYVGGVADAEELVAHRWRTRRDGRRTRPRGGLHDGDVDASLRASHRAASRERKFGSLDLGLEHERRYVRAPVRRLERGAALGEEGAARREDEDLAAAQALGRRVGVVVARVHDVRARHDQPSAHVHARAAARLHDVHHGIERRVLCLALCFSERRQPVVRGEAVPRAPVALLRGAAHRARRHSAREERARCGVARTGVTAQREARAEEPERRPQLAYDGLRQVTHVCRDRLVARDPRALERRKFREPVPFTSRALFEQGARRFCRRARKESREQRPVASGQDTRVCARVTPNWCVTTTKTAN